MPAYIVTGLGYGDEGKGTTAHWLTEKFCAHTVIRTGGPQAFHRIVTASGKEHVHSQFGSGTLAGAATHLSRNMVVDPDAVLNEGSALIYEHGIRNVFENMTIHEDALVITPFHRFANRLLEFARGEKRIGTVGMGVGETVLDAEIAGIDPIRAKDLKNPRLREKLEAIRLRKLNELSHILGDIDEITLQRLEAAAIKSEETVSWTVKRFELLASKVKIVDTDFLASRVLLKPGTVVFEGSQGVLLDRWYGFHPHTTKVGTTTEPALSILDECGYEDEIKCLGVLRAYHTRHGAGPFVTESPELSKKLPDEINGEHPWQGNFRVGHFDMIAAKYAANVCKATLDGLMITCLDRLSAISETWDLCESYKGPEGHVENISVSHMRGKEQLKNQERLCALLNKCSPDIKRIDIPKRRADFRSLISEVIGSGLKIPVVAVSAGPTEKDKICL